MDVLLIKRNFILFSLTPKSSGYNYGTEISLEKNYELAIIDNLNQFVSILSGENIFECE